MARWTPLLLSLVLGGCGPAGLGPRAAFIQEVLVADNRVWLADRPGAVADKFAAMGADPYDFMRGSAALHFADLARPRADRVATAFLQEPAATGVLLFGDPHPENLTVCRADPAESGPPPAQTVEVVDLDAAGFGPWLLDLRRAALGLAVLLDGATHCGTPCVDDASAALAGAYAATLRGEDPGLPTGAVLAALAAEGAEEGAEQRRLNTVTVLENDVRRLILSEESRLRAPTRAERALADALVAGLDLPPGARVFDVALRTGSGISSMPALRFVLAWDRGAAGPADDDLMQLREVVDPPWLPGRAVLQTGLFAGNGDRVVGAAATLWSRPDADPRNAWVAAQGREFKATSWGSWFQDVDHDKLAEAVAEGELGAADLVALGADLGRVLAASHARGHTLDGAPAGPVIRADLAAGGGARALSDELVALARADRAQLRRDHALFVALLDQEGPLLGADRLVDGVEP